MASPFLTQLLQTKSHTQIQQKVDTRNDAPNTPISVVTMETPQWYQTPCGSSSIQSC